MKTVKHMPSASPVVIGISSGTGNPSDHGMTSPTYRGAMFQLEGRFYYATPCRLCVGGAGIKCKTSTHSNKSKFCPEKVKAKRYSVKVNIQICRMKDTLWSIQNTAT